MPQHYFSLGVRTSHTSSISCGLKWGSFWVHFLGRAVVSSGGSNSILFFASKSAFGLQSDHHWQSTPRKITQKSTNFQQTIEALPLVSINLTYVDSIVLCNISLDAQNLQIVKKWNTQTWQLFPNIFAFSRVVLDWRASIKQFCKGKMRASNVLVSLQR